MRTDSGICSRNSSEKDALGDQVLTISPPCDAGLRQLDQAAVRRSARPPQKLSQVLEIEDESRLMGGARVALSGFRAAAPEACVQDRIRSSLRP
ncbi:MAG: hypothetical protein OEZ06_15520 [Myxococcales bacterium]|nr:hypothetical protein [Myxococcales bacterium]